jgi:hypothetical protein
MNKITMAALAITAFTLAPLVAFAAADMEQIENYCKQEAKEKGVPAEKLSEYISDCVASNLKAEKEVEGEEAKSE